MVFALATYQALERSDQSRAVAKFRSSTQIQRDLETFKRDLGSLKDLDGLIKNRKVMKVILSAYGLDSEINSLGRVKAVLNSDLANQNSLANRLNDRRFREMAADLLVRDTGLVNLKRQATIDKIVEKFLTNEYEKKLGEQDPSIREARYFVKNIGKVKNVYEILSDPVLRTVTTVALGLPREIAIQPVESQAELIRRRLDLKSLQTGAITPAGAQRSAVETDITGLTRAGTVATAASKVAQDIAAKLQAAIGGYDGLAALQDPGGANAAEIAIHTAAIPELARQQGLAVAADRAIGRIADALNRMSQLRALASDPANAGDLAAHKAEFADLAQAIHDEVATGADYRFDGVDHNLLDGSLAGPLSVAISSTGATVSLATHDLSTFLAKVDDAAAAFAAVADASDIANLAATGAAISTGGPMLGAVRDQLRDDRDDAAIAIGRITSFTATLDTTALATGRSSVADADARALQITAKLNAIKALAAQSAGLGAGDDRSALVTQFNTLRAEIDALIGTPATGLDNILDATQRSYALTGGKSITVGGRDLTTSVQAPLAGASIGDAASAQALVDQIEDTMLGAVEQARDRLAVDKLVLDQAATVFDPRGKLDEDVRKLASGFDALVNKAAVNGVNLLKSGTSSFIVQFKSSIGNLTIDAQPGFAADVGARLTAAVAQLPANLSGAGGAYEILGAALDAARDAANALDGDRRAAESQLLTTKRTLLGLPKAVDDESAKPTEAAKRFALRFLAIRETQASGEGGLAATPAGAILGLFA